MYQVHDQAKVRELVREGVPKKRIAEQLGWDLAEACERLDANATAAFGGSWGVSAAGGNLDG